ncbi:hypothetical protein SELMODRAFT_425478 [Selaginella moellendorffii]|uniref:Uncharacterized protein n=1 Tax=Selaginella moellendorffii TaxID=88036 RepID=D8ST82_SELML|nr:hypothetical protein SELMODRAFT_425478 [Selaginella moellendorffii]
MASALGRHRFSMLATQPRIFHRSAAKRLAASGLWSQRRISIVKHYDRSKRLEERIERAILDCRFLTLFGVIEACCVLSRSFIEYFNAIWQGVDTEVILLLVEAMGTVMLIFGMGLYELFERPKWLEIRSLDELKTKLGHVIVMILLVGMFDKSKKIVIHTGLDLVCLLTILFSSGCLFLLCKLHKAGMELLGLLQRDGGVRLAVDSGHSSQLWMLIPDLLASCLWIEPLPSAMQADVLTFVYLRSYRFRPNDLLLLSKRLLESVENLDFWVRRAAQTLLEKCSQSSNSKEASDFDEIPDFLKKHMEPESHEAMLKEGAQQEFNPEDEEDYWNLKVIR